MIPNMNDVSCMFDRLLRTTCGNSFFLFGARGARAGVKRLRVVENVVVPDYIYR